MDVITSSEWYTYFSKGFWIHNKDSLVKMQCFLTTFLKIFSEQFCGTTDTLFWTSHDVCSRFQSQSGSPHLRASSAAHNGLLRFTSGVTPADLLAANMVAEPFSSTHWWGSNPGSHHWQDRCFTKRAMPAGLLFFHLVFGNIRNYHVKHIRCQSWL